MRYLIGVDLGTSATKTILMNENGEIIGQSSFEYPMYQPGNGWAEQEPLDWRNAALATIREVVKKTGVAKEEVVGIGLSGQMHGLVMLDENNQPLGRSIIWCDQRTTKQTKEMLELAPMEKWLEITANPPLAGWTAAKILWMRENEPERFAKCKKILLPKDYVRYVLTGEFATDVADASGMQILDVKNRCWSDEILDILNLDKNLFAKVYESQEITGYLLPEVAKEVGLTEQTAVVAGASDNACAAVGTGVVREGEAFTTIGTSAIVYSHLEHYTSIPDGGLHVCCCAVPGCWHTMGGPQSAGLSLEWFKDKFCQDLMEKAKAEGKSIYETITEITRDIPIGSEKLLYLPFLMGERTPHIDPDYRGAFVGLNVIHSQAHMLRAIMEGVAYSLADCNNLLKAQGVDVVSMRACGGGSRSPVWQKMMAALYGCDVRTLKQEEGPAYGAAILAGTGTGVFSSIQEACDRFIQEADVITCDEADRKSYLPYHRLYDKVCGDLREDFSILAEI